MLLEQCPEIVQMWFTDHPVNYAQFAGQENQVLLPMPDRRWAVHDLGTGRPLYPPFGPAGCVAFVALSTPTSLAVTTSCEESNSALSVWNVVTGQEISRLSCETPLGLPAISPDARWVAASSGTNLLLWSMGPGQQQRTLRGHTDALMSIAFSPDSRRLATASRDSSAILWDVETGRPVTRFTHHTNWLYFASFSPDGRRVATASFDCSVRVWEAATGNELLPPLWHGDGVRSAEFSPDGNQLVTAGLDFLVRVWDTRSGKLLYQLRHNSKPVYAAFSPTGHLIVTACYDGTERVWTVPPAGHGPQPTPLVFSEDGSCFALCTNETVQVYRAAARPSASPLSLPNRRLSCMLLNKDGSRLLTVGERSGTAASNGVQAVVWNTSSAQPVGSATLDPACSNIVLSAAGDKLVAFSREQTVVWDLVGGREMLRLKLSASRVAFDRTGERVAVASSNQVQIWNLAAGKPMLAHPLVQHVLVDSLSWHPDGRHLLSACWNYSFDPEAAQVWDVVTGQPAGPPLDHRDGVRFATFSQDGKKVLTCSEDFTAMLWDWRTGSQLIPPLQHNDQVVCGAFSPDGRWIATGCRGGAVRVWDTETGEPITPELEHPAQVESIQWANGSKFLLTKTTNGRTRCWPMNGDPRPLRTLVSIAELLSAQQIHRAESAVPQTKAALKKLWEELHGTSPGGVSQFR